MSILICLVLAFVCFCLWCKVSNLQCEVEKAKEETKKYSDAMSNYAAAYRNEKAEKSQIKGTLYQVLKGLQLDTFAEWVKEDEVEGFRLAMIRNSVINKAGLFAEWLEVFNPRDFTKGAQLAKLNAERKELEMKIKSLKN